MMPRLVLTVMLLVIIPVESTTVGVILGSLVWGLGRHGTV